MSRTPPREPGKPQPRPPASGSSVALLAEAPHLLPRCSLRSRLLVATFKGPDADVLSWRRVTGSELRSLSNISQASPDSAVFTLFSIPSGLRGRLAAAWKPQGASNSSRRDDEGLVADLVDFFAFVAAPVQGTCSVRLDRVDERGMDAWSGPADADEGIAARINLGEGEAALLVGPVDFHRVGERLVRVTLQAGEGVFVRKGIAARLVAGGNGTPLIASVVPEA